MLHRRQCCCTTHLHFVLIILRIRILFMIQLHDLFRDSFHIHPFHGMHCVPVDLNLCNYCATVEVLSSHDELIHRSSSFMEYTSIPLFCVFILVLRFSFLLTRSLTQSIAHSLTPSLPHSLTHSLSPSLIHTLTRSPIHSLTDSLTH